VSAGLTCVAAGALAQADGVQGHDGLRGATLRAGRNRPIRVGLLGAEHNGRAFCRSRRLYHRYGRSDPQKARLRQHSVHDPAPVAAGADVVVPRRRRRFVRASRLLAVGTLRGERCSVVRLDARADGSGAVDEPSCPRHGRFHPLREIGIVMAGAWNRKRCAWGHANSLRHL
jgi:hypothetical protein